MYTANTGTWLYRGHNLHDGRPALRIDRNILHQSWQPRCINLLSLVWVSTLAAVPAGIKNIVSSDTHKNRVFGHTRLTHKLDMVFLIEKM